MFIQTLQKLNAQRNDSFNLFTSLNHSCILEVPKILFFNKIIEMRTRGVYNNTIFYCVKYKSTLVVQKAD